MFNYNISSESCQYKEVTIVYSQNTTKNTRISLKLNISLGVVDFQQTSTEVWKQSRVSFNDFLGFGESLNLQYP